MASDINVGTYTRTQTFSAHVRTELVVPGRGAIGSVLWTSDCDVTWSYDYATSEVQVYQDSGETLQVYAGRTSSTQPEEQT